VPPPPAAACRLNRAFDRWGDLRGALGSLSSCVAIRLALVELPLSSAGYAGAILAGGGSEGAVEAPLRSLLGGGGEAPFE